MINKYLKILWTKILNCCKKAYEITSFLFIVYFTCFPLLAQTTFKEKELNQYQLDTWGEQQGMITSAIVDIGQDPEGYIWISSHRGLLRFDGVKFKFFNRFEEDSFYTSGMRVFLNDSKGRFLVGSNGRGIFILKQGRFVAFTEKKGLNDPNVYDLYEDSRKRMWVGTKEGVYYSNENDSLFHPVFVENEIRKIIAQSIKEDKSGRIWFAAEEGLFFLNEKGLIEKFVKEDGKTIIAVNTMTLDRQGTFWIGSYSEGLFEWKYGEKYPRKYPLTQNVKNINQIYQNKYGVYFIATDNGLYRFYDNKLSVLTSKEGLIHNNINSVFQDNEGSFWIGSYYGGFQRLKNSRFHNISTNDGLPNNTIHALYQEDDTTIWSCTGEGIAYLSNGKPKQSKILKKIESLLSNLKVRDIIKDSKGIYWIATYSGVLRYDPIKDKSLIIDTQNGLRNVQSRVLLEDKNQNIWVGTRGGLHRLNMEGVVQEAFTLAEGLHSDLITDLLEDKNGIIWISTTGGIHFWNPTIKRIMPLITKEGRENNTNFRIYIDSEGLMWVGSTLGLWLLKDNQVHYFSKITPSFTGTITQVLEDESENFWLTTDIGILKVERRELLDYIENPKKLPKLYHYDKSDGMKSSECTGTAKSIRTKQNILWFATSGGIAVLSSRDLKNEKAPNIVIEQINLDNTFIDPNLPEIVTTPKIHNIEIEYSGLSFISPEKTMFKYRLFGYDEDWIDVGNRRIAYYTNIMPGDYTFKVIGCNSDGIWNFVGDELIITIHPPFWQTKWFAISCIFGVVGLVFTGYRYRINRMKREKRILETKVKIRTSEIIQQKEEIEAQRDYIEEKNKELDNAIKELENANAIIKEQYQALETVNSGLEWMVKERTKELTVAHQELDEFVYKASHDLKGPLARISGLCSLALQENKPENALAYFQLLEKESKITNDTLNKLIKARNVRNSALNIRKCNLNDLVKEAWQKIIETRDVSNIIFLTEIEAGTTVKTDWFMLRSAVFLVIENAVCYKSHQNPQIFVRYKWDFKNSQHQILIEDNGIGIDSSAKDRIFEMFFKGTRLSEGAGLGLYIAKIAMERIAGSITLKDSDKGRTVFELIIKDFMQD
jgi:ligand-binding sensor domain-containing protein/signal transduction histidine kinase